MKARHSYAGTFACISLAVLSGCASPPPSAIATPSVSTATLVNTAWRLTQLGTQFIENPAGPGAIHFVLEPSNLRVTGNSGCNRMFGQYVIEGDTIKFHQIGGTKMACEARMELEQRFLGMFATATHWQLTGVTLRLTEARDTPVATFVAMPPGTAVPD